MTTFKERLQDVFNDLRYEYLEENHCTFHTERVEIGDSYAEMKTGYSNCDWNSATKYAEDELSSLVEEILNNN
jgi:hypothetical protein